MKKYSRFFSLLALLLVMGGCSGRQSDADQTAETLNPSEAPTTVQEKNKVQATAPSQPPPAPSQATPPQTETPAQKSPVKTAPKAKPTPKTPAAKAPAPAKPAVKSQKLPDLSEKEKQVVSKVTKEVQTEAPISTQNAGLTTVNRVLVAQQAMWLLSGSFSTDFKALEPNLPVETDEYKFSITQGDQAQTVVKAIAKNDKLHSFTGAAVAVPTNIPESALCRTKLPSQTPPQPPTIKDGQVTCANDGVLVNL